MDTRRALLEVLRETRALLALPDNDFSYSHWNSAGEALYEFDGFIEYIEGGHSLDGLELPHLFAPTGSIQEVSLNSGWGKRFCEVAERFDLAWAKCVAQ